MKTIKIGEANAGGVLFKCVSMRAIHTEAGLRKEFIKWSSTKMRQLGLKTGRDFAIANLRQASSATRIEGAGEIDYLLRVRPAIAVAKALHMVRAQSVKVDDVSLSFELVGEAEAPIAVPAGGFHEAAALHAPATVSIEDFLPIGDRAIGPALIQTVSARRLHEWLGNRDEFAHWIKDRIEQYELIENVHYVVQWENSHRSASGTFNPTEYHLTIDTAKELAMVERNEQGKAARRYFIACERKAKAAPGIDARLDAFEAKMSRLITGAVAERDAAIAQNAVLAPKAQFFDDCIDAGGNMGLRATAKEFAAFISEREFHDRLKRRKDGMLYLEGGHYIPRAQFQKKAKMNPGDRPIFVLKEGVNRHGVPFKQALTTPEGRAILHRRLLAEKAKEAAGGVNYKMTVPERDLFDEAAEAA